MVFAEVHIDDAVGAILAHTLRTGALVIKKGTKLAAADIANLKAANVDSVTAALLEAGDMGEDQAAFAIATALGGSGVDVSKPLAGRCNLHARSGGVLDIDAAVINALNASGNGVLCSTLQPFAVVEAGQAVATLKVIPYALHGASYDALLRTVGLGAINVLGFNAKRVGLILSEVASGKQSLLDKAGEVIAARVETLGGEIVHNVRIKHEREPLAGAIRAAVELCDVVLVLGAASTVDVSDTVPSAIVEAGGEVELFGIPVDPGNLMVMAAVGRTPVIGLPGCARSPRMNAVDLVLPRLFAGMDVGADALLGMGVGGLLHDVKERPQPRETHEHVADGAVSPDLISGVVLAAGQSKRMGKQNKLLMDVGGRPLVRRAVETALAAGMDDVVVVTGHDADLIRGALSGLDVRFVHNPHFADGMSTSLRSGIGGVSRHASGAMVILGDMPEIAPETLIKLTKSFVASGSEQICAPFYDDGNGARRGNPVIWPREFFAEMMDCSGDFGARELLSRFAERLTKVKCDDAGIHKDIDMPEDMNG